MPKPEQLLDLFAVNWKGDAATLAKALEFFYEDIRDTVDLTLYQRKVASDIRREVRDTTDDFMMNHYGEDECEAALGHGNTHADG